MQSRWLFLPAASLSLVLNSCVSGGGGIAGSSNPSGTGPFDSRGNYVEAWADNSSAWPKGNTEVVEAKPDRPAPDVAASPPQFVVVETTPNPETTTTPVVYKKPTPTVTSSQPKAKPAAKPTTVAKTTPKPKPAVKKELVKSKPKAKPKPKATRHTVKSGDNLYNIAKRYGTSVSAIQSANGVKGSMIRPGQTLTIPR